MGIGYRIIINYTDARLVRCVVGCSDSRMAGPWRWSRISRVRPATHRFLLGPRENGNLIEQLHLGIGRSFLTLDGANSYFSIKNNCGKTAIIINVIFFFRFDWCCTDCPDSHQFMQKTIHNVVVARHSSSIRIRALDTPKNAKKKRFIAKPKMHRPCGIRSNVRCRSARPIAYDGIDFYFPPRPFCVASGFFFFFDFRCSPCRNGATETVIIIMTMVRTIRCASRSPRMRSVRVWAK